MHPAFTGHVRAPRSGTDKKRVTLACGSRPERPDVAFKTSPLCDVLPWPTGMATENGYLIN
jgi:hypothetical protein